MKIAMRVFEKMEKRATRYPAVVAFVIVCLTIFLFSYIVPKFSALLSSLKVQQPLLTRVVFGVGEFTQNTWFIWLPTILILMIAIPLAKRFSPRFNPRKMKKIFAIMETALILFLSFIAGAVALAIYLPILSLMDAVNKQ